MNGTGAAAALRLANADEYLQTLRVDHVRRERVHLAACHLKILMRRINDVEVRRIGKIGMESQPQQPLLEIILIPDTVLDVEERSRQNPAVRVDDPRFAFPNRDKQPLIASMGDISDGDVVEAVGKRHQLDLRRQLRIADVGQKDPLLRNG